MSIRAARRWLTSSATHAAWAAAPALSPRAIGLLEWSIRLAGPRLPVIGSTIADNMRSAGVYEGAVFRSHFQQAALHLANAVRIFRAGQDRVAVARLACQQVDADETIADVRRLLKEGRGVIIAPPHVCNYVLTLVRLGQELPVCVYLRWSKDRRKREMKHTWCRAAGLRVILEPASAADPASRAAACVDVLREGAALVMTPDIAQKSEEGVPVQFLGRQAYLPTGPASIAMLAQAPLVPVFGRLEGPTHVIYACEPIFVESLTRPQGGRQAAIRRAMQPWTDCFEAFLRRSPEAWFLWADSRWTRFFRGDPRYAAPPDQPGAVERESVAV